MHETSIHVYPTDCDMLGHVNHATMITFLEHARWAMLEPHMTVRDWMREGVWSVVRHVDIGYTAQALPGDDLVVR
ncbi:MAG TPA: thioesterase family protein, partial [Gemmatimonadaceae bacterium]|nr:thioesterase family protein [Gemmatimonadaceae bacterium]